MQKLALTLGFLVFCSGCQTLMSEDEVKAKELRDSQTGIIVNYLNKGQADRAHMELRKLIKKFPDQPDFENLMGLTQLALKQPKLAVRYFKKALEQDDLPAYTLNLASAYVELGSYKRAIRLLKDRMGEGLEGYSYPERFHHNIGLAFEKMKRPRTAVKYYKLALRANPANYMTIMQMAKLFDERSMEQQAIKGYKAAIRNCRSCYEPVKLLALIYARQGKPREASEMLKRFSALVESRKEDRALATLLASKLEVD